MFLSVIVPCFNEEEVLPETHRRLGAVLDSLGEDYELLYVNDGSRDRTLAMLRDLAQRDRRVRVINLSRNFGHQIAVSAGLDHAQGRVTVIIDADLQDPPAVIPEMIDKWREGYDVVYGQRRSRPGESAFKLGSARLFYRFLNLLSDRPIPLDAGDFRLLDRAVVDAMRGMREYDRFLRGMVSWVGFRQYALPYDRDARFAGESKYPLMKMLRLAADGILSFSVTPLRAAIVLGLVSAALAFLGIVYAIVLRLTTSTWVSGWTLLFVAILFMGGVQLVTAGIIGEYVGRIYREVKGRPLYLLAADDRDRGPERARPPVSR
ncbi:glycosyltransferase family 2 protein [Phenylobacterium sp.]|jgi:dolichol-phosphate mannosyltransferase|uniref:glycosyltransferase family 2 protein n=1 Tax=Phenylobacterium sp. TaxID=1871053 RepID=UPI002F930F6A